MANAGLGDRVTGSQAGLNEPLTMFEKAETANTLRDQGWDEEQIANALGGVATPDTPEAMSTLGLLPYGAQAFGESLLGGVSGLAEDRFGADGLADGIDAFADWVGPSEEQEQAKAARDAERGTLGQGVDAAIQEAPGLVATIGAGAAVGAGVGAVSGPGAVATALAGGTIAGIGWLRIRDENRDAAIGGKAAMVKAKKMFGPNPTAEQIKEAQGLVTDEDRSKVSLTDEDINKVDLMSAVSAAPEAIAPLRIFGRVGGKGAKAAIQSAVKRAAVEGGKDAMTEGLTEVGQTAVTALAFDPALRAKMDEAEVKELAPWVMKYHGKEAMISFIAGAGLGGAAGATTGAYEQSMTNAKTKSDVASMVAAADLAGLKITDIEEAAKVPEKAEAIRENASKLTSAELRVRNAEEALQQGGLTDEGKAEVQRELTSAKADQKEAFDAVMPLLGGKTFDAAQTARQEEATRKREQAIQRLNDTGEEFNVKADVDLSAIEELTTKFEEVRATRQQAERSVQDAATPKGERKAKEKLRQARDNEAEARAEIAGTLEGKDPDKERERVQNIFINQDKVAARSAERQAEIDEERVAVDKADNPAANAQQIINDYEAGLADPEKKKKPQMVKDREDRDRLQGRLAKAKGKKSRRDLRNQIDALDRKIESATPPAVVAAREALLEQGIDPTPEAEALPTEGEAAAEAPITPETEPASSDKPKDQTAGEASAEPAVAYQQPKADAVSDQSWSALSDARKASDTPAVNTAAEAILIEAGLPVSQDTVEAIAFDGNASKGQRLKRATEVANRLAAELQAEAEPPAVAAATETSNVLDIGQDIGRQYRWRSVASELQGKPLEEVEMDLRDRTAESGDEWSATFDRAGKLLGAGTNGHFNAVSIPLNGWNKRGVVMTHTHPQQTPFSSGDIRLLSDMADGATIRAVLPDGQTIEVVKTNNDMSHADIERVASLVKEAYGDVTSQPGLTNAARGRITQTAQLRMLQDEGFIEVTQPMSGLSATEEMEVETTLDALSGDGLRNYEQRRAASAQGRPAGAERIAAATEAQGSPAAGSDPVYPEFREQWASGVSTEELIQRPEFKAAVGEMMTRPATSKQPGFDSDAWHANRQYTIDGQTIVGTEPALDRLIQGARDLAAKELKKPTKPVANNRKMTIITGPPASGKSTIANEIAYDNDAAIIDSDEYKKALPEFGNGEGANAVHTESKGLADVVEGALMGQGANVVYPKVGHEKASIDKLAKKWKDAGYEVKLVDLKVPSNEAMRRMLGRFADSGRLIPPSYLLDEVGDSPSAVHQQMAQENLYDGYAQLDGLTPYGSTPGVLAQSGAVDPLAGTKFQVSDGSPAQRGQPANEPGSSEDTQQPAIAAALDPDVRVRDLARTVDPEKVGEFSTRLIDALTKRLRGRDIGAMSKAQRKQHSPLAIDLAEGRISTEQLSNAVAAALDGVDMEVSQAIEEMSQELYPGSYAVGGEPLQEARTQALRLMNAMTDVSDGRFFRERQPFKKTYGGLGEVSVLRADDKMKRELGFTTRGTAKFTPAGDIDPNDTTGVKLQPTNIMSGPALERAKASARYLQNQVLHLNRDAIDAMTVDNLVDRDALRRKYGDDIAPALKKAEDQLKRLKDAAAEVGPEGLRFRYRIDDKGRIYADGEFTPQSGEDIKYLFEAEMPDGSRMSLKDMMEVDHTGSGWQIAAIMAKDEQLAPVVNIHGGQAGNPSAQIGDIYTRTLGALETVVNRDAANGDPVAIYVRDNFMKSSDWSRPNIKPAVIAINYGGGKKNFRDALQPFFQKEGEPDGVWSYIDNAGIQAVEEMGPATKRMKDWALNALKSAIGMASFGSREADLKWTVGRDGEYQKVVYLEEPDPFQVRHDQGAFKFVRRGTDRPRPTEEVDVGGTARTIFSQIIQGYDADILHEGLGEYSEASGGGFVSPNHDSYTVPPQHAGQAAASIRTAMQRVMEADNPLDRLLREIDQQLGIDAVNEYIAEFNAERPKHLHLKPLAPFDQYGSYDPAANLPTSIPAWQETDPKSPPPYEQLGEPTPTPAAAIDVVAADQGEQTGVALDTSLPKAAAHAESNQYPTGRDFKLALQEIALNANSDLTGYNQAVVDKLADFAVEDAKAALVNNGNAVGWYDQKVTAAKRYLAELHPELATDPEAEFAFTWALAVTSNGLKVDKNFELADAAYEHYKRTGSFPTDIGIGEATTAINNSLGLYTNLVEGFGGWEAARDFMTTRRPVKEIEQIANDIGMRNSKGGRFTISGEGKNEVLPGAVILGPKIGGGFFSNLYGNFDELTMDRWLMRTVGRWRGNLIEYNLPMEKKKRGQIRDTLKGLAPSDMKFIKGFFNGYDGPIRKVMSDAQIDNLANEITKRSTNADWRGRFNAAVGGEQLRLNGNSLSGYLDGQLEQPRGVKDRQLIRSVFTQALDRLKTTPDMSDLTMSDLQALLWYPEKRLYDTAKKPPGEEALGYEADDAPDYENAARNLVSARRGGGVRDRSGTGGSGSGAAAVQQTQPSAAAALDSTGDAGRGYPGGVARGGSDVRDTGGSGGGAVVDGPAFQTAARAALDQMGSIAAQVGTDAGDTNILMDGGKSGYALRGDNIISVFSSPDSPPNVAGRVLADGVARGGRRLDGFDTFLPGLYAKNGFRAVARLPFDPEYAPTLAGGAGADWDYQAMAKWNDGKPDVVFMVYDPDNANADTDNVVADYDAGIAAQDAALADIGEGQIDMVPTPAAGQDIVNALGETVPLQYLQLPRGVNTLANRISSMVDKEAKAGRPINMGKVMHDVRTDPGLTNYATLAETATKLDGGKNGPTYRALLKRFNKELAGALKGRSIMAAGRDMQARLQQELEQHTADKMRPSIAMGIDINRVQAAPPKRGIDQPKEYKTPERVGSAIYQSAIEPRGTFDRIMKMMAPVARKAEAAIFNKQSYLKQIEKLVGKGEALVSEGMSRMAQMMTATTGRQAFMMTSGGLKWDANEKIFKWADGTKGLEEIFQFNGVEDYQNFQGWAYAKRDRDLQAAGKAPRMTDDLRAEYENISDADKARYDAMLDDYKTFNASLRQLMLDSGLIDKNQKDALEKENEYVPMYRVFEDPAQFGLDNIFYGPEGFSHPDPGIKRLSENPPKVGEENGGSFGDLMEGIHNNAIATLHAASQNIAHQQAYNFMSENLDETKPVQVKKLGKKAKKAAQRGEETDAFKFMKDGKEFYWKAKGDPEWTSGLALAISGLSPPQLDGIDRALKQFNSFQRSVITSTPAFAIRSVIRDAGQAYVQSGTNPLDIAKRNASMLKESWSGYDRATLDLMAAAGVGGYQMQGMPEVDAASLRKRVKAQASGRWHQVRKAFGAYEQLIGGTELAARTSIYDQQVAKGVTKADASYEALNMIDYNRAGASRVVQKLTYMVLFLNPRLQGMYRLFETTAGDGKAKWAKVSTSLAARGLVLGGLGLGFRALTAMDDEAEDDYKQLSVADRSTYYHIPLHSMGMDRFLRLPKPFEVGALFSTLPVAGIDAIAMGPQGMNDLGQMAAHVFMETFSLNPTPQAVRPIVETMLNKNMFTGREIEGMRLQGLPKALRSDLQTGGIAKALGNKAISPAQIQHLLRGYLGPLGMFLYDSVDATMAGANLVDSKAARSEGVFGGMPPGARELSNFTAKWMFSANEGERGTKYVGEFYDLQGRIKQYTAAINEASRMGDVEEVQRLLQKSKGIMPLKKTMNKVGSQLTKLNQAMRAAQLAPGLTDEQRQQQIDQINRTKNKLVRNAMEMARQYGVVGSFGGGLIGDTISGV